MRSVVAVTVLPMRGAVTAAYRTRCLAVRPQRCVRIDRAPAAGMDLEVQVRRPTARVPGVADVPDQLAQRHRTRRPDVAVEVRVEVRVAVAAVQPDLVAAETARAVRD